MGNKASKKADKKHNSGALVLGENGLRNRESRSRTRGTSTNSKVNYAGSDLPSSFVTRTSSADVNNNLKNSEISSPVTSTPVSLPVPANSKSRSRKSVALHFIKSKIKRIFNFRKQPSNDINGNPITRKASKSQIPHEMLSSENPFSRPISSEMAKVRWFTAFPLSFGRDSADVYTADARFRSHKSPQTTPKSEVPPPKSTNLATKPSGATSTQNLAVAPSASKKLADTPSSHNNNNQKSTTALSAKDSLSSGSGSSPATGSGSASGTGSSSLSPKNAASDDLLHSTPSDEVQSTPSTVTGSESSSATTGSLSPSQSSSGTTTSSTKAKSKQYSSSGTPKKRSNRTMSSSRSSVQPKKGCCQPVAPPVYLDYSSRCGVGSRGGIGTGTSSGNNAILNMLKNVDVIEELQYHVPGGDCGDNSDSEFEYYLRCNECGEMEPCRKGGGGGGCCGMANDCGSKSKKPVVYSRRQRFNFANGGLEGEECDGPPFAMPHAAACPCHCCRAGLRRNPNCQCKCCGMKGRNRGAKDFDEIPVGKNPVLFKCDEPEKEEEEPGADKLPKNSGVYFYDADQKKFVHQEPRTPTPIIIEMDDYSTAPQSACSQDEENIDLTEVIRCIPPLQKEKPCPPEPLVLPVVYAGCCDMKTIAANLEAALKKQQGDQKNKSTNPSGSVDQTKSGTTAGTSSTSGTNRTSTGSGNSQTYSNNSNGDAPLQNGSVSDSYSTYSTPHS